MNQRITRELIVGAEDLILVTGATGFIGSRLVANLLDRGFRNLRCFARPFSPADRVQALLHGARDGARVEVFKGNLLSREDCSAAASEAAVIFHLAAARGEKSFPDAFMNSVVTTRNLLDAARKSGSLRRFVNISSFTVYTNKQKSHRGVLDESCPIEDHPELRGDPYCFAKVKQEEIVREYGESFDIPYVIIRPGYVYGPGNAGITGRVGISTFGVFLHLGGSNSIPCTYVDNCADAIALAGLKPLDSNQEVFNVVDDEVPSSRRLLRLYKKNVREFTSVYVPHAVSYILCYFWEAYSRWSHGQLDPAFNRRKWYAHWKKTRYSNEKLKSLLGWRPKLSTEEGLRRFCVSCRSGAGNA